MRFDSVIQNIEDFRIYILGNPISIPEDMTMYEYFMELIINRKQFSILLAIVIICIIINFILILKIRCRRNNNYYLIISGFFLVFSGLIYKYSYQVLSFDVFNKNRAENSMHVEDKRIKFAGGNGKLMQSLVDSLSFNNFDDFKMHMKPKPSILKRKKILLNNDGVILTDEARKNDDKENNNDDDKEFADKEVINESMKKKESVEFDKEKEVVVDQKNDDDEKADSDCKNSVVDYNEIEDSENDLYMKKIAKNFKFEQDYKNKVLKKYNEIKEVTQLLEKESRKFLVSFEEFYDESIKIETEMNAFNVILSNYKYEAQDVTKNVGVVIKLAEAFKKLTEQNSSENLVYLFDKKVNTSEKKKKENITENNERNSMIFLSIYFCFQIALFLYIICSIMAGIECNSILRFILFLCFIGNLIFGIYMMIFTQILDKTCIVGNIEGCRSTFTNGFAEFAATTGFDLKTVNQTQKTKMYNEINKIQKNTENVTDELGYYIEYDPIQKQRIKNLSFNNIFDKIYFIEEEFETLTNDKISKKPFYKLIDKMRKSLNKILIMIEKIGDIAEILEIYKREISFIAFIKFEKDKIYRQVDRQMLRSKMLSLSKTEKFCWKHKKNVCESKNIGNGIFISLFVVNIFMTPFLFL